MSMYRRRLMIANALKKSSGINYPGLIAAWSAKGKTNDDEDRAILKDLTGNGHDITLNGFAFSGMSGYGGYNYRFNKTLNYIPPERLDVVVSATKISGLFKKLDETPKQWFGKIYGVDSFCDKEYKIKVSGLQESESLQYAYYVGNVGVEYVDIHEDGIYTIPASTYEGIPSKGWAQFIKYIITEDRNLTIEIIPEYLDALVFDGVDDYGQSIDRIKALTKYTIILKRKIIKATNGGCVLYKGDLRYDDSTENFGVEFTDNKYWYYYSGLLGNNKITPYQEDIIYAKEKSYNGQQMNSNLDNVADNPIVISTVNKTGFINMAFYSAYLFDRSLDEQEIKEFIRKYIDPEYLLPSEIPTPDCYYDFSLGSNEDENRETIKDQSGNLNDAKAYNFAWAGMSGYGGYILFNIVVSTDNVNIYNGKLIIKNVPGESNLRYVETTDGTRIVLHITGIPQGAKVIARSFKGNHFETSEDGTYIIENTGTVVGIAVLDFTGECNIEITEEPQYPGALVLDGTDDYIALEAFNSGFKTMFMVCNPFISDIILYDQRKNGADFKFAIYNRDRSELAYKQRNDGKTYINGVLNTTIKTDNLINKKHLITIKNNSISLSQKPIIGSNYNNTQYFANMAIYKFLGFKEELTEEQIQAIIKKYNLLDGVDEIEVS